MWQLVFKLLQSNESRPHVSWSTTSIEMLGTDKPEVLLLVAPLCVSITLVLCPLVGYWSRNGFFSLLALRLAAMNGGCQVMASEPKWFSIMPESKWREEATEKWPKRAMLIRSDLILHARLLWLCPACAGQASKKKNPLWHNIIAAWSQTYTGCKCYNFLVLNSAASLRSRIPCDESGLKNEAAAVPTELPLMGDLLCGSLLVLQQDEIHQNDAKTKPQALKAELASALRPLHITFHESHVEWLVNDLGDSLGNGPVNVLRKMATWESGSLMEDLELRMKLKNNSTGWQLIEPAWLSLWTYSAGPLLGS